MAVIANALSLSNPAYDAWALPATATADETFKYYADVLDGQTWQGGQ